MMIASVPSHLCLTGFVLVIVHFPSRSEEGTYYALELGTTNFRTLRVHLGGKPSMTLNNKVECQPIPKELMTGTIEVHSPILFG